jgi:hypothetical protein
MCKGKIPAGSISETMPMRLYQVNKGNIHFKVKSRPSSFKLIEWRTCQFYCHRFGFRHTGYAAHSMLETGADYGIINLNIKMYCPITQDQQLVATGTIINIHKTWRLLKVKL